MGEVSKNDPIKPIRRPTSHNDFISAKVTKIGWVIIACPLLFHTAITSSLASGPAEEMDVDSPSSLHRLGSHPYIAGEFVHGDIWPIPPGRMYGGESSDSLDDLLNLSDFEGPNLQNPEPMLPEEAPNAANPLPDVSSSIQLDHTVRLDPDTWHRICLRDPSQSHLLIILPEFFDPTFHTVIMESHGIDDSFKDFMMEELEQLIEEAKRQGDEPSEFLYKRSRVLHHLRQELAKNYHTGFESPLDGSFQPLVHHSKEFYDTLLFLNQNPHLYEGVNIEHILLDPYKFDYRFKPGEEIELRMRITKMEWGNIERTLQRTLKGRGKAARRLRGTLQNFFRIYHTKSILSQDYPEISTITRARVARLLEHITSQNTSPEAIQENLLVLALGLVEAENRCPDGVSRSLDDIETRLLFNLETPSFGGKISQVLQAHIAKFIDMHAHPGYRKHNNSSYQEPATEIIMGITQRLRLIMGLNVPFQQMVHPHMAHFDVPAFSPQSLLVRFFQGGDLTYLEIEGDQEVEYTVEFQPFTPDYFAELLHQRFESGELPEIEDVIKKNQDLANAFERVFITLDESENEFFRHADTPGEAYKPSVFKYALQAYGYLA